jgi:hypothetical protein
MRRDAQRNLEQDGHAFETTSSTGVAAIEIRDAQSTIKARKAPREVADYPDCNSGMGPAKHIEAHLLAVV